MEKVKSAVITIVSILAVVGILFGVFNNYGYVFSKRVTGEILEVEKLNQGAYVATGNVVPEALFSFAVAIRSKDGEIYTSSSEDRQWAVAKKGLCVEALFYPYPFWELSKNGTYNNARLIKLFDCPNTSPQQPATK